MRLLVFRHGIAEDHAADGTDASRALTGQGVERTRAAARGLAAFTDPPDVILSSPKTRALQTAREAGAAFGRDVEVLAALADGPPAETLRALAARTEEAVMIVGHEPMLSELVEQAYQEIGGRPASIAVPLAERLEQRARSSPARRCRADRAHRSRPSGAADRRSRRRRASWATTRGSRARASTWLKRSAARRCTAFAASRGRRRRPRSRRLVERIGGRREPLQSGSAAQRIGIGELRQQQPIGSCRQAL